ncbi:VOC family protein [Phenylobacterium sp.]|uniref:VOC family protein n=1 Tax=Phenylobacterium sp. TaxID=1871053 RepID=UPI00289C611F|nr:VOC family protein [Phenylobacterium sp.]
MAALDHLVWAAPDLDGAIRDIEARTGAKAAPGGAHPGNGTCNAVLGLGARSYLEVLAPDPAQAPQPGPAAALSALPAPTLHTFAVATDRLDRVAAKLEQGGLPHAGIIPMSRRLPSGRLVRWRLLIPAGHAYGPLVPFFIDWGDSPHPAENAGEACRLTSLTLSHPEAWSLRPLLERLDVEAQVETGPPAITADLDTPKGAVRLSSRDHVAG